MIKEISEYEEGQVLECTNDREFEEQYYTKGRRYIITGVDPYGKELFLTDNTGGSNHPFDDRRILHRNFKIVKAEEL